MNKRELIEAVEGLVPCYVAPGWISRIDVLDLIRQLEEPSAVYSVRGFAGVYQDSPDWTVGTFTNKDYAETLTHKLKTLAIAAAEPRDDGWANDKWEESEAGKELLALDPNATLFNNEEYYYLHEIPLNAIADKLEK